MFQIKVIQYLHRIDMFSEKQNNRLHERRQTGHWRERIPTTVLRDSPVHVRLNGKNCISFCSNDYLNLSQHPEVISAAIETATACGVGGQSSPLVSGYTDVHAQLEEQFSTVMGYDRAMLFTSGYAANMAVITTLAQSDSFLLMDKFNHASLVDAGRFSDAKLIRYPHRNYSVLQERAHANTDHKMIISDSVFSMDGDVCDAEKLVEIARESHSLFMLDDAHGFGVLGESGLGIMQAMKLTQQDVPILSIPMGKSLGCTGAIVLMTQAIYEHMIQFARPYIYSTSIAPMMCSAASQSLRLLCEGALTEQLRQNILLFKEMAKEYALPIMNSDTAIQPILLNQSDLAVAVSAACLDAGFFVRAISPPTVPIHSARLRVTITVEHTISQMDELCRVMSDAIKKMSKTTRRDNGTLIS